jgi:hypothetical protein
MIKKESKTIKIFMSISPFLIFIIINMIPDFMKNIWESWYLKNEIIAYVFFLITIILASLKNYKERWLYIWIGFTLYYSSCFLFSKIMGFSKIIEFFNYSPSILSDAKLNFALFPDLFFTINVLFFIFLLKKFKLELMKIFYLIFVYYYVYCYFLYEQYQLFLSNSIGVLKIVKYNVILNSIVCILFLIFFIVVKSRNLRIFLFIGFVFFNFLTIHIFKIYKLISIELFHSLWNYVKYFLIYSQLCYYLIFLVIVVVLSIQKRWEKSVNSKV